MFTFTVVPDVPEDGDGEHPVIVQVNDGAPASATVTVMGTVTIPGAARAGIEGRTNRTASMKAVASKTLPLLDCKRPSRLLQGGRALYLVLRIRTEA